MLDRADRRRSLATLAAATVALVVVLGLAFATLASGSTVPQDGASDPIGVDSAVAGDADDPNASAPGALIAVYPNPVADGDRGEYVVVDLRFPLNWTLTDGETTVAFPFGVAGEFALSASPSATREHVDVPVVRAPALSLANGGEELTLRADGEVVDALAYESAPEGEVLSDSGWRPVGFDPRQPRSFGAGNATAFVLPDAPSAATDPLANATDRLYLAGYTLASTRVVDRLVAAERRGADVRVLLEGGPVGGISRRQATLLDELVAADVSVRVVDGPRAAFAYHHPKYAVADDRAVVLTENWKPSGTGGTDSRGWGVRVGPEPADGLAELFRDDFEGPGTVPWTDFRNGRRFEAEDPETGESRSYPQEFAPGSVRATEIRLLTAPGNARTEIVGMLDAADERVAVLQPTFGSVEAPMVRAVVRAAERGVRVRILLSGAWYVAEENRRTVGALNDLADRRDLPLTARLADPSGRYGKIHAKGVLVDDAVVVGSLNWNRHAATENREVVLALHGSEPAGYFRRVFDADWRASAAGDRSPFGGVGRDVPVGLLAGVAGALVVAGLSLRATVEFEDGD